MLTQEQLGGDILVGRAVADEAENFQLPLGQTGDGSVGVELLSSEIFGYTDLMVDGAPSPHQPDTTLRWLID